MRLDRWYFLAWILTLILAALFIVSTISNQKMVTENQKLIKGEIELQKSEMEILKKYKELFDHIHNEHLSNKP